jgi:hypothetical protein
MSLKVRSTEPPDGVSAYGRQNNGYLRCPCPVLLSCPSLKKKKTFFGL